MLSSIELNNRLLSAEYYFATLMDQLVDISMQLEPVDEPFVRKVDELYYTIEAVRFFVNRGIGAENPDCMAVYNKMMEQIGIYTTLPSLTVDTSLVLTDIILNPTVTNYLPVLNQSQRLASNPSVGLLVYQTDATEGLYVYKSTGWTFVI